MLDISDAEEKELQEMLGNEQYRKVFKWMQEFCQQQTTINTPDVEASLQKTLLLIDEPASTAPQGKWWRKRTPLKIGALVVAGIVLVTIIIPIIWRQPAADKTAQLPNNTNDQLWKEKMTDITSMVEKHNTIGTRSRITLADGSTVWLNADSRLIYPQEFTSNTREVALEGEAFFDIAKNKKRPFIIHLKKGSIKVLGTSFNVKAYDGEKTIETSVVTGHVAFVPAGSKLPATDTTFITPDLKAIYTIEKGTVTIVPTIAKEDKDWTEGRLVFKNTSLKEIAAVLNRNFGKEVVFSSEDIADYRLTGTFVNNSLEDILYYLSRSKPFTYRITEKQVLLSAIE